MEQIIECVPNFSEGRDPSVIDAIVRAAASVEGAYVLHVDSGVAANRTVVTFAGAPEAVVEAAFRAVRVASELIDMRTQMGEHPRIGATDVLPIVPVRGVSLAECAVLAHALAARIATELGIPIYCYEAAALVSERRGLEACRRGGYEGLREKIGSDEWQPDFGPNAWNETVARTGACVIGARGFLGAVNFNLKPTGDSRRDLQSARAIAREIRTATESQWSRPCLKAIGWWIDEYGFAQVSTNLTDMHVTGLVQAFNAVTRAAKRHSMTVTGTEVIGLLPEWALTDAVRHLTSSEGDDEMRLLNTIELLGLDTMSEQDRTFDPNKRIVDRLLNAQINRK